MVHTPIIESVIYTNKGSVGVTCGWDMLNLYNARRVGDHDKYQQRKKDSADGNQIMRPMDDQSAKQTKESKTWAQRPLCYDIGSTKAASPPSHRTWARSLCGFGCRNDDG